MVASRLYLYIFLFNLLVLHIGTGFASPTQNHKIQIAVPAKTVIYGKSISIHIIINKTIKESISELLLPLKDNFKVSIVDSNELNNSTRYKVKLYPLKTGKLIIPTLASKSFATRPVRIKVVPPKSENGQPLKTSRNNIKTNPWVREQSGITISIITTDSNIILNRRNISQKGIISYLIPQETTEKSINGQKYYQHIIGWNIFFLYKQKVELNLPEVEYIKNGVPRFRFYTQSISFNPVKLPVYVSPAIPVGKLTLEAEYMDNSLLFKHPGETSIIKYTLSGHAIPGNWLPSLTQHYNSIYNKAIHFSSLRTIVNTDSAHMNVTGSKTVNIAYTPLSNGFLPINDISLQFFNPETGLLDTLTFKHSKPLILNIYLQFLLFIIGLIVIYIIIHYLLLLTLNWINFYRNIHQFKSSLGNANSFYDIKNALYYFCKAETWPVNISINQWLKRVNNKYILSVELENVCTKLNKALYTQNPDVNVREIKEELGLALKYRKVRRNYLWLRIFRLCS